MHGEDKRDVSPSAVPRAVLRHDGGAQGQHATLKERGRGREGEREEQRGRKGERVKKGEGGQEEGRVRAREKEGARVRGSNKEELRKRHERRQLISGIGPPSSR